MTRTRRPPWWALGLPALLVAGLATSVGSQIFEDRADGTSRRVGGAALSSRVDPDARFFWELDERPPSLVPLDELVSGGPPPDGIPAIDQPRFETPESAAEWLARREPVVVLRQGGDVRAYPVQILVWHEIVNDVVGDEPVAVTFCPLCNSAATFSRRTGDRVLDFGTSGRLYKSDLVMYDRQTKSLWPQIEGRAVVGPLMGAELEILPTNMVSWEDFRAANPTGRVLSRPLGFNRPYGENPYAGYDSVDSAPFLPGASDDGRLDAKERVVAVEIDGTARAYPFSALAATAPTVVHDRIDQTNVVVLFERGTASALDSPIITEGRDVGAAGVFRPVIDGSPLTLTVVDGEFIDEQTQSRWNLLGDAVSGPLAGRRLEPVTHLDTFWFAWAAFHPDTTVWEPSSGTAGV